MKALVNVRKKGDNPKNLDMKMGCGAANPLQRTAQWWILNIMDLHLGLTR